MRERKPPPAGSALNTDAVAFITPLTALGSALSSAGEQQSVSWSGLSF
jgi:hypothetical protein